MPNSGQPPQERRDYENFVSSTEAERRSVAAAKLATNDALNEVYADFGVNRANFEDVQKFREDMKFVRSLRQRKGFYRDLDFLSGLHAGSINVGSKVMMTIIVIAVTAFCYGMWDTLTRLLGHPIK